MLFSEAQLDKILLDLKRGGISSQQLQNDILDHVCCMMETKMENGMDYETAYRETLSLFGSLRKIQLTTTTAIEEINKWSFLSLLNYFLTFLYLITGIGMLCMPVYLLVIRVDFTAAAIFAPLAIAGYFICFTRIEFKKFELIPYDSPC